MDGMSKNEVAKKVGVFIKAYVWEFEKKLQDYVEESSVGGASKHGKMFVAQVLRTSSSAAVLEGAQYLRARHHKRKAKSITQIFQEVKRDELRKMLVGAACLIFYCFQIQFENVSDEDDNWKRGLQKLAIDACNRSISYIYNEENYYATDVLSRDFLTKALIMGKSNNGFVSYITPTKVQKFFHAAKPGHTVKNKTIVCKSSDIYEEVGIRVVGRNGQTKYYKRKFCGYDFGYRWAFNWENERSWISKYEEDYYAKLEGTTTYFNLEQMEAQMGLVLTDINYEDPNWLLKNTKLQCNRLEDRADETLETVKGIKKEIMEEIAPIKQYVEEIWTKISPGFPNLDEIKIFSVLAPVKTFTGREHVLAELHDKLQTEGKHVVVSQCTSISGLGGIGKSEVARKYAWTYCKSYQHLIWIDSETHEHIINSFHNLANELRIRKPKRRFGEQKTIEIDLLPILARIYKRFRNSKSLFIFDNVYSYRDIRNILPSNVSPMDEKPVIIITSRRNDWDIGDEGDVSVIKLEEFTPEEALRFVKKILDIKDDNKLHDASILNLCKQMCFFPLALRQAASYIKTKKFSDSTINNYLLEFHDEEQKRRFFHFKTDCDRYIKTTYNTWQLTFKNIEKDEANGSLAIRLVEIMANLVPDHIPLKEFAEIAGSEENLEEAVKILVKYSLITVEDNKA